LRTLEPVCGNPGLGRVETDGPDPAEAPVVVKQIHGHGQGALFAEGSKSHSPIAQGLFVDGQAFDTDANPVGVDQVSTLDVNL
jgi:hypothetical protein